MAMSPILCLMVLNGKGSSTDPTHPDPLDPSSSSSSSFFLLVSWNFYAICFSERQAEPQRQLQQSYNADSDFKEEGSGWVGSREDPIAF